MGMFDSLYDAEGREWQTKAFECNLDVYRVGDRIESDTAATFQVAILGDRGGEFIDSLATVRGGVLVAVNDSRDDRLSLLNYDGYLTAAPNEHADRVTESKES